MVKNKSERWHKQIGQYSKQITDHEVVVEESKERLTALVEFWDGVKTNGSIA